MIKTDQLRCSQPETLIWGLDIAQILSSAQQKLRGVVRAKLEGAALAGEHATVLRYTRLYPPLGLEEEGVQWFTQYLQQLIRSRAKEDYNSLVDGADPQCPCLS